MVKNVVGGLQDAAKGANEAIEEAEQKAIEDKEKWNASVCTQFCSEIPEYEGKGIVRDECPDHCMEENPEWKRVGEVSMDVQQAADAAKAALCVDADGKEIEGCTPQIAQLDNNAPG